MLFFCDLPPDGLHTFRWGLRSPCGWFKNLAKAHERAEMKRNNVNNVCAKNLLKQKQQTKSVKRYFLLLTVFCEGGGGGKEGHLKRN